LKKLIVGLLVIASLYGVGIMAASVLGGEVVTLYTRDAQGREYQTSLWVAEQDGRLWLRAGRPGSGWLKRLVETPEVRLERAGVLGDYRAVVVMPQRDRINTLMTDRYGWADQVIGLLRDPEAVIPIRLDPRR
jgi:hypothetical protein